MKILVVDDDPVARTLASWLLRKSGHEVIEAADGEMAWRILENHKISFILCDWVMPNLSGIDLCRRIRAATFEHYVYVLLCTSKGEKADLIEGMDAGADDFLVKPISIEELRVRVRAAERILDLERTLADKNQELELTNKRLQAAYEHIEGDLRAAAGIQKNLLPGRSVKTLGVACNWYFRPSSYISGDIFNFFAVDDRQVGFYLLDVSGHGVAAAMLSVALSVLLTPVGAHSSILRRYDAPCGMSGVVTPGEVISELNRRFQTKDDRYFTMSYGLLDSKSSILRLAHAGNPNPLLIQAGGGVRNLTAGGMPIGLWPEMEFDCIEVPFTRGDRLVLYSDGISECPNMRDEKFGDQRLIEYLSNAASKPLDAMLVGLEQHLETWRGSTNFEDDVSLLAVEITGEEMQ